jgi:hypothetical protein
MLRVISWIVSLPRPNEPRNHTNGHEMTETNTEANLGALVMKWSMTNDKWKMEIERVPKSKRCRYLRAEFLGGLALR